MEPRQEVSDLRLSSNAPTELQRREVRLSWRPEWEELTGRKLLFVLLLLLLLLPPLVLLIVLLHLLKHTQVSWEGGAAAGGRNPLYLDGLGEALQGQVDPDAELEGEEVLPVRPVRDSRRTNGQESR